MKLACVTITYGRKINLGDYQSANLEVTLSATPEPGDTAASIEAALWKHAKAQVKAQAEILLASDRDKALKLERTFNGVPIDAKPSDRLDGELPF